MAVTCFCSLQIPVKNSAPIVKPVNKSMVLGQSYVSLRKTPTAPVRSSLRHKIFEDQSEGIICYRDENGEVVCEGLDEGPRFHQHLPRTSCQPRRDAEIANLLHQRLLQIVNGSELQNDDCGVAVLQEDLNCTGSNKLC